MKSCPTEKQEMVWCASLLDSLGLLWFHPANEGARTPWGGAIAKRCGLKKGVPDIFILTTTPHAPLGAAVELKREGGRMSDLSEYQKAWMIALGEIGWRTGIAFGVKDLKRFLVDWGYLKP